MKVKAELELIDFQKKAVENATKLFNISDITDPTTKSAFESITNIGTSASTDTEKLEEVSSYMHTYVCKSYNLVVRILSL